ncbi:hypothetical protein AAFF_G00421470 [Aldrovandia affinis]|uniref:Uncharacterized protein n=1 Tax=Aldrovandia affinis TaxID=143900 RepID=A0AAD7S9W6_9TELE|nr:hypothetical protein AAFF_G00421470 [Aldrovandia affinis]
MNTEYRSGPARSTSSHGAEPGWAYLCLCTAQRSTAGEGGGGGGGHMLRGTAVHMSSERGHGQGVSALMRGTVGCQLAVCLRAQPCLACRVGGGALSDSSSALLTGRGTGRLTDAGLTAAEQRPGPACQACPPCGGRCGPG